MKLLLGSLCHVLHARCMSYAACQEVRYEYCATNTASTAWCGTRPRVRRLGCQHSATPPMGCAVEQTTGTVLTPHSPYSSLKDCALTPTPGTARDETHGAVPDPAATAHAGEDPIAHREKAVAAAEYSARVPTRSGVWGLEACEAED